MLNISLSLFVEIITIYTVGNTLSKFAQYLYLILNKNIFPVVRNEKTNGCTIVISFII